MRVPCFCMACQAIDGKPCGNGQRLPLVSSNFYIYHCPNGRATISVLQQQTFEVLSEIALIRLAEEAYDDTVSKFSTALERFFEFCSRIILLEHGEDTERIDDQYGSGVFRLSERQIGAGLALIRISELKANKEWPKIPKLDDLARLRNKVVHTGYFPTRTEAVSHAKLISEYMAETLSFIAINHREACDKTIHHWIKKSTLLAIDHAKQMGVADPIIATASLPMQISIIKNIPTPIDIEVLASVAMEVNSRSTGLK